MDLIQNIYETEVRGVIGLESFSFSKLIVNGRKVPLLILNGKLVVLPSRFCLYLIERKNLSFSKANKQLKMLARFVCHLSRCGNLKSTNPSTLLSSVNNSDIEEFLKTGGSRAKDVTRTVLMFDFFTWLEREEGIKAEVSYKYSDDRLA